VLHVLAGGLIGAVVGAASVVVLARLRGERLDGAAVGAMALAGLVGGAVTAATLGAGAAGAAGVARVVAASAAGGAAGSATHRATLNAAAGRSLEEGALEAAGSGAIVGGLSGGAGAALRPVGDRLGPLVGRLVEPATAGAARGVLTAVGAAARPLGAAYTVGAFAGATRRAVDNARFDQPLGEDVPPAAARAGVDAVVRLGLGRVATPAVGALRALPVAQTSGPVTATRPPTAAPASPPPLDAGAAVPSSTSGLQGALDGAVNGR
jgi:hypothetical protein